MRLCLRHNVCQLTALKPLLSTSPALPCPACPAPPPLPCPAHRVMDSLFKPLPVITHMHRQPERRTPGVVSLAFALLVAAPLLAFVAAALRAGANFKVGGRVGA